MPNIISDSDVNYYINHFKSGFDVLEKNTRSKSALKVIREAFQNLCKIIFNAKNDYILLQADYLTLEEQKRELLKKLQKCQLDEILLHGQFIEAFEYYNAVVCWAMANGFEMDIETANWTNKNKEFYPDTYTILQLRFMYDQKLKSKN